MRAQQAKEGTQSKLTGAELGVLLSGRALAWFVQTLGLISSTEKKEEKERGMGRGNEGNRGEEEKEKEQRRMFNL